MTPHELASKLNGKQYKSDLSKEDQNSAIANNLVVVYGYSDDLMEFRGAIYDEVPCYNDGSAFVDSEGLLPDSIEDIRGHEDLENHFRRKIGAFEIQSLWCDEDGYSWTYRTEIPHATFDILEGDETYCRGIVFSLSDLKQKTCMKVSEEELYLIYTARKAIQENAGVLVDLINKVGTKEEKTAYREGVYAPCVRIELALGAENFRIFNERYEREAAKSKIDLAAFMASRGVEDEAK